MDNRIGVNFLSKFNLKSIDPKKTDETKAQEASPQVSLTHRDAEQILNAMGTMGLAFKAQHGIGEIDPRKYLSPERIADIQASMVVFEGGVAEKQKALGEEFGILPEYSNLAEADKLEMAAKMVLADQ